MKNKLSLSLLLVFPFATTISASDHHEMSNLPIKLESKVLAIVDGNFINADVLEIMRSFQRLLVEVLLGKKNDDGHRFGSYHCNGKDMSVIELAQYEEHIESTKNSLTTEQYHAKVTEIQEALTAAKKDFLKRARQFQQSVGGSKENLILLVEEFCQKRNRTDSLMFVWSRTKEANESLLYDQKITSAKTFKTFLLDLFHFLGDLIHSCPKAHQQLQHRMTKWNKIKGLLPQVLQSVNSSNKEQLQKEFLKQVKQMHLDTLSIDDITVPRLQKILKEVRC